ncbi:hypothetical protein AURDEDRAFT_131847 [Auricularia subglabra TFB-10046 SS5]|uniref:Uncharacterized protein n=1 Tax=Auricularia subglabra (strain TFB-10046 / SS5) TaxID=717982 RepID=J0WLC9_AURST|nr:hypothetical protein AURDEDRAFT_131847 [Auricularia subglabra TFB-10046 SS5]
MDPRAWSLSFIDWASQKIGALIDARLKDIEGGPPRPVHFPHVLTSIMAEYEIEPFARPDFSDNLDSEGEVCITTATLREVTCTTCRNAAPGLMVFQRAVIFLSHHSVPDSFALTAARVANAHAPRCSTAVELWLSTEQAFVREQTCRALGIPTDTADRYLPDRYISQRQIVSQHEFGLLSETEQADWNKLALERKAAMERNEMAAIIVQNNQTAFIKWLGDMIHERMNSGALGMCMLVEFTGFYVGEEDHRMSRFKSLTRIRGQIATYGGATRWHNTPEYNAHVDAHWKAFCLNEIDADLIFELPKLELGTCADHLSEFRDKLEHFFEELFQLQCNLIDLDAAAFWQHVAVNPTEFVSRKRLPNDILFGNPQSLSEQDFRAVYVHVWLCRVDRDGMDEAERFVYEPSVINKYIALDLARQLAAEHLAKKRCAACRLIAASTPGTPGTGPMPSAAVSPVTMDADPQVSFPTLSGAVHGTVGTVLAAGVDGNFRARKKRPAPGEDDLPGTEAASAYAVQHGAMEGMNVTVAARPTRIAAAARPEPGE